MRVTWEESDIKAGRRFGDPKSKQCGIIGYISNTSVSARYVVISLNDGMIMTSIGSLSDGKTMTLAGMTKNEVADWLTMNEYLPDELLENDQ